MTFLFIGFSLLIAMITCMIYALKKNSLVAIDWIFIVSFLIYILCAIYVPYTMTQQTPDEEGECGMFAIVSVFHIIFRVIVGFVYVPPYYIFRYLHYRKESKKNPDAS